MEETEKRRLLQILCFEAEARARGYRSIAGVDEAGRGPLAGPVVAAACILPAGLLIPGVNDSKQLDEKRRNEAYQRIVGHPDVAYAAAIVDNETIDRINILQATIKAMCDAVGKLSVTPDYLLVDGLHLHHACPCQKIIKGDARSLSIAAASIIAKVTRDREMLRAPQQWPHYGFDRNKGYGTKSHLKALERHGPCPLHRMSFAPVKTLADGALQKEEELTLFVCD